MDDLQALSRIPHLSDVPLAKIVDLANAIEVIDVADGEVVTGEGDLDHRIFIVLDGEVELVSSASGTDRRLDLVGQSELFGLISLIDNAPGWATARSVGASRIGVVDRHVVEALTAEEPTLDVAFQRALGAQLGRTFRSVSALVQTELSAGEAALATQVEVIDPDTIEDDVDCDVAVLGGGPLGMMYAQWVKRMRPESRVVQLERRLVPGYKVGESTLSTTVRAFLAMGFTMPQMRRLFGNKAGIRFWWADEASTEPEAECDIVDLEETFQIERRVFELALQRLTREQGVDYRVGTNVEVEDSDFDSPIKTLACTGPDGADYSLRARIVCDATGPASVLPRHLGTYRKEPELHDTFQTNCYFAYFKQKSDVPVNRWDEAATRHLCMPDGWVWFITVHSWESADDDTITGFVDDVMNHTSPDDADVPGRQEFAERHGVEFDLVTSIGITVREDRDTAKDLPIQQRFQHYVEKYPALASVLEHYELIEQPYREKRRPYAAFLGLAHDSTKVAGDGWLAVGDSAMFSNPLFSHGINYGSGQAYMGAVDTVNALNAGRSDQASFAAYQEYADAVYPVLLHETDMFYRSWLHRDAFEKALNLKFYFGALDVLELEDYSDRDPYVFDLLDPGWIDIIAKVREIQKASEASGGDPADMARDIAAVIDPYTEECRRKAIELDIDFNAVFSNFDAHDQRVENKRDKPRAYFRAYRCPTCDLWQDDVLPACPNCGTPNPEQFMAGGPGGDDIDLTDGEPPMHLSGAIDPRATVELNAVDVAAIARDAQAQSALQAEDDSPKAHDLESAGRRSGVTERIAPAATATADAPVTVEVPSDAPPAAEPRRRQRKEKVWYDLGVAEVVDETADTRSFVFDVPDDLQDKFADYKPGQFVTLSVEIDGDRHRRAYTLSSAPTLDDRPRITVKRVPGGTVSNHLCETVGVGSRLEVLPPDGRFTVPERDGDIFLFCAGSGITPGFAIAREHLATSDRRVRMLYINRTEPETIFAADLRTLKQQHGRRFKLSTQLTSTGSRLDTRDVQAWTNESTDGLYFICGPWGFMDVVEESLLDMGVDPDRIHIERFASPKKQKRAAELRAEATPDELEPPLGRSSTTTRESAVVLRLNVFGQQHELMVPKDEYLHLSTDAAGIETPWSCEEGYCGTCIARVAEGSVEMDVEDGLTKGQKKRGLILACQARPTSATLTVCFDE